MKALAKLPWSPVTPEFEDKLECINYMCTRIKLHTHNDSVIPNIVSKRKREYYNQYMIESLINVSSDRTTSSRSSEWNSTGN
jgi:hypothetical protein